MTSFIVLLMIFSIKVVMAIQEGRFNSFFYSSSNKNSFDYSKIENLIVFGDSYSHADPSYDTLLISGHNYSGGLNWPQQLIRIHDMYIWDFAYNSATFGFIHFVNPSVTHELPEQHRFFNDSMTAGKKFSNWKSDDTLFAYWFGINDCINTNLNPEDTVQGSFKVLLNFMDEVYKEGGRNILLINIPPYDRSTPKMQLIETFNNNYNGIAKEFCTIHPDVNIFVYNSYDEFNYILENNESFNITYTTGSYETSSNKKNNNRKHFFWHDELHPTDKVHEILAEDIHTFLNEHSVTNVIRSTNHTKADANYKMKGKDLEDFLLNGASLSIHFSMTYVFIFSIIYLLYYIY